MLCRVALGTQIVVPSGSQCGSLFPVTRANAQWVIHGLFMGLSSTIIYTSELILCSIICLYIARDNTERGYF